MSLTVGLGSRDFLPDGGLGTAESVLRGCTQCGTCSAICPLIDYMDYSPRALNALQLSGHYDEALRSQAIWDCTSCYACTLNCPKQIPVTEAIYALKRASMREGVYPRRFVTPVMAKEFVHFVLRRGRSSEAWMSVGLYLRTQPLRLVRYGPLGLRLMWVGRLSFRREHIRQPAQVRQMFSALEASGGGPL